MSKFEPLAESCEPSARRAFFDGVAAHGIALVDDCGHVAAPAPWYTLDEVGEATTDALQLRR